MRLINTKTQAQEQYESTSAPPYAILPHTWTEYEITYQDVATGYGPGKEAERIGIEDLNQRDVSYSKAAYLARSFPSKLLTILL
ncbi:hypothetical protein HBH98_189110 [Parastagonospora nodorum]|uniref:Uncharacterized protein n=1 Tax=Phaeosphaeria nodorum (strain SN15 / ATCC MYA-4574 / FGSC 10173) TaxID=321614 RepID=A0A7U2ICZ4_PHANO|nr:hypothetical protein HBH54_114740 [Parastagonospora nodorum]QRD07523.1 hypothetical protein JI435_447600 [Parastagonospora nodorum SN15]KAH3981491.1 hypothetical protein HBH52_088270 [Parastagonospora nodorum]KAH4022827.1 hypothetical protein HBI09_168310 [Parastagonospora nodorum]KAH4028303.1 hypothetical protein HBI13_053440 [Parastagonospora nodorum]